MLGWLIGTVLYFAMLGGVGFWLESRGSEVHEVVALVICISLVAWVIMAATGVIATGVALAALLTAGAYMVAWAVFLHEEEKSEDGSKEEQDH